jgi:hypothetical protein
LLLLPLAPLFILDLARQDQQLLQGQQAAATLHELLETPGQLLALAIVQLLITLRDHLGGHMENGLLNGLQQTVAQHLQVEGQVVIQIPMTLPQTPADPLQVPVGF